MTDPSLAQVDESAWSLHSRRHGRHYFENEPIHGWQHALPLL